MRFHDLGSVPPIGKRLRRRFERDKAYWESGGNRVDFLAACWLGGISPGPKLADEYRTGSGRPCEILAGLNRRDLATIRRLYRSRTGEDR